MTINFLVVWGLDFLYLFLTGFWVCDEADNVPPVAVFLLGGLHPDDECFLCLRGRVEPQVLVECFCHVFFYLFPWFGLRNFSLLCKQKRVYHMPLW